MKRLAQITDLPVELLIYIASFLDLEAILQLLKVLVSIVWFLWEKANTRLQTCRRCLDLSRHRRVWTDAFETVRRSQSFFYLRKEFEDMTPLEMQRTLVSAHKAEQAFLRPRKRLVSLDRNFPGSYSPIRSTNFLLDRFILTVHYSGTVSLWTLSGDASCSLYAQMPPKRGWNAAAHHVSADKSTFYLTSQNKSRKFVLVAPFIHNCLNFVM